MTERKCYTELSNEEFFIHKQRRLTPSLPAAILLLADRNQLLGITKGAQMTVSDKERMFRLLLGHIGHIPWTQVTVSSCMNWLPKLSAHDQRGCVRIMRRFLLGQIALGASIEEQKRGWDEYVVLDEPKANRDRAILEQNEQQVLTDMQCRKLIQACLAQLETKDGDPELGIAVLLRLTLMLEPEELCALTFRDFTYLENFPHRLVVHISKSHEREKGKNNFHTRAFTDPYAHRTLPLPVLLERYYAELAERARQRAGQQDTQNLPLISLPENRKRKRSPEQLRRDMEAFLEPWTPKRVATGRQLRLPTVMRLVKNTALQRMRTGGFEDEEIRRMQGKAPQSVSARHYNDFQNEEELNKLGALLDRYLNRYHQKEIATFQTEAHDFVWHPPESNNKVRVRLTFTIQPHNPEELPKQLPEIQLGALRGLTGQIRWQTNEHGGTR